MLYCWALVLRFWLTATVPSLNWFFARRGRVLRYRILHTNPKP